MRRRRGSILIGSLIVMVILMVFSGVVFGFAYINHKSAEQQQGILMARAAADSLLTAVGSALNLSADIPFTEPGTYRTQFTDGPVSASLTVSTDDAVSPKPEDQDPLHLFLECSASYKDWESGLRRLEIVRRHFGKMIELEWIWR